MWDKGRLAGKSEQPCWHRLRFPLATRKRIKAQNSGQGAVILRAASSLACRAPETGTMGEEGPPDPSPSTPCALGEHRGPQPTSGWCLTPSPIQVCLMPQFQGPGAALPLPRRPEPPAGWHGIPEVAVAHRGVADPGLSAWEGAYSPLVCLRGNLHRGELRLRERP